MSLSGKRVIVTGGAKGLGAAICHGLAAQGAQVAITDVDGAAGAALAREIEADGGTAFFVAMDVASEDGWRSAIAQIQARWGGVDILVNNAAIASAFTAIEDRSPDDWDRSMAINARGPFLGIRALLPMFRAQGGGVIVNVSSVAGLGQSQIMDPAYACSKAALSMLTRIVAAQHGGEGVRCNSVHPGPIDSPLARQAYGDADAFAKRLTRVPIGRLARMDEVVAAILFLASDASSYLNGVALPVDGGALVQ